MPRANSKHHHERGQIVNITASPPTHSRTVLFDRAPGANSKHHGVPTYAKPNHSFPQCPRANSKHHERGNLCTVDSLFSPVPPGHLKTCHGDVRAVHLVAFEEAYMDP
ncbi:unnamed protein product [Laminaria digitata]